MKRLRLWLASLILPGDYLIRPVPKLRVPVQEIPEVQQMWAEDSAALHERMHEAAQRAREPMLLAVEDPDAPQTDF